MKARTKTARTLAKIIVSVFTHACALTSLVTWVFRARQLIGRHHSRTSPKHFGGAMKFCPNFVTFSQIMILWYISDTTKKLSEILRRKTNFVLKSWWSLKKKKKKNLSYYFLQFIIVTSLNFLTLPKFFVSLPEKP